MFNLSAGYFFVLLIIYAYILIMYLFYLLLIKKRNLIRRIIIAIVFFFLIFYSVQYVNIVFGLLFTRMSDYTAFAFLALIVIHELVFSRIPGRFRILVPIASFIIISIALYSLFINMYGGYFRPTVYPDSGGCIQGMGIRCAQIEDKGKVTAANTELVEGLMKKYGRENITYKAMSIHLAHDKEYIKKLNPNFLDQTGCVIVVTAGNEGYVMQEEKSLRVVYSETLEQFKESTKNTDPLVLKQFYDSLH